MEEETINRIILAIQTQLNPAASSTQRQEAQQVIYLDLDQIHKKQTPYNCIIYLFFITWLTLLLSCFFFCICFPRSVANRVFIN